VPLVLLERSWWAEFTGIYLVRFGLECERYWFLSENSNKFQKNKVLEGKISWGRGNTWAKSTGHTSFSNATSLDHAMYFPFKTCQKASQKFYFLISATFNNGSYKFWHFEQ
jgi:hypothetical protein